MKKHRLWIVLLALTVSAQALTVDDMIARYQRADQLQQRYRGKIYKASLHPNWFDDGRQFWYRNDLSGHRREFIVVNAFTGTRQFAFDHDAAAQALEKVLHKQVDRMRLPIEMIRFEQQDGQSVVILMGSKASWLWNPRQKTLSSYQASGGPQSTVKVLTAPRPSRGGGEETYVTFFNRSGQTVEIFWINLDGKRQHYHSLSPDAQYRQHTFSGHVWLATDKTGKVLNVFEAADYDGTAYIGVNPSKLNHRSTQESQSRGRPKNKSMRSLDGHWEAFYQDYNLYIRDLTSSETFPLSTDGREKDAYGGPVWWSPDSKKIVAMRTIPADERKVYYVESSPKDQLQPKLHSYNYLKPGDRVAVSKPQLFELETRSHIPVSDTLFKNPWRISDLRWEPDSRSFTFLFNQRGHQVMRVLAVDSASGKVRPIVNEECETFFCYSSKTFLHRTSDGNELIWMSERDGWNHLYLYDMADGQVKNQITSGPWVVRKVDRVDEQNRQIWFEAGGIYSDQDPYYLHYCRINFDGTGLTLLTEADGTHKIEYSPDGRYYIDTWSRVDQPPVHELRRSQDGTRVCELERADISELVENGWRPPERFTAKGRDGKTDIYGIIIRPSFYKPTDRYPVIEDIYAGPHSAFVPKSFHTGYGNMSQLAELGFILVKIDGMGTSQRSKAFHDVCWKNLGDSGFPDRIAWIRAAAHNDQAMDLTRVGIYGGSAGGQSSTRALLAHGDFYKVAVSDCGCHDNRVDKIWWNEQWMGWPVGPHYAEQSNVTQAHRLTGKLLLAVGEMDQNVDPASTLQVVNALIKAGKDFDLLVMTGRGHGSLENPYGKRRRSDYFVKHLLGVDLSEYRNTH